MLSVLECNSSLLGYAVGPLRHDLDLALLAFSDSPGNVESHLLGADNEVDRYNRVGLLYSDVTERLEKHATSVVDISVWYVGARPGAAGGADNVEPWRGNADQPQKRVADYVGITTGKELCRFRLAKENIATVLWKDLDHGYVEKGPTMMMIGC